MDRIHVFLLALIAALILSGCSISINTLNNEEKTGYVCEKLEDEKFLSDNTYSFVLRPNSDCSGFPEELHVSEFVYERYEVGDYWPDESAKEDK